MSSSFLPTRSFVIIKKAMEEKKQLTCQYKGYTRDFCPYVLGHDTHGKERVLALLVRNTPSGTIAGGWECLQLESVWKVEVKDGEWLAAPAGERPACVESVDVNVEATAA